ncbi:hypothetical protein ISS03_03970 [Patescibacteria group bacterium]|nr:hypothetical protein [Patescibacteria group bacterium]
MVKKISEINTFTELFKLILNKDKEDSRQAAREVRKLLYSSRSDNQFNEIGNIVKNAQKTCAGIQEDWRKENFVTAVSVLYFLHPKEDQPDFLFPWLLELIQHENGNIRRSAERMIVHELGPLTVHIRFPNEDHSDRMDPEKADFILLNLFINLNNLLATLWKPTYKKYKYIDSLPTSPYKTVSRIFGEMEDDCGLKYMKKLKNLAVMPT